MAERLKAAVLKTVVLQRYRGFESLSLRLWLLLRSGARVAESGSLLRSCTLTGTEGSNPSYSDVFKGKKDKKIAFLPFIFEVIAQLDRASDCGSEGRQFEPA